MTRINNKRPEIHSLKTLLLIILVVPILIACGGGGSSSSGNRITFSGNNLNTTNNTNDDSDEWVEGVFLPASNFRNMCANPVSAGEEQGTFIDENNFLRSHSNNTYLWYEEIDDRDPALHSTPDYFDLLKTDALTPSGNFKDNFHFSLPTQEWELQSQSGISAGYGANFAVIRSSADDDSGLGRLIKVAYIEPGTPATAAGIDLDRGAEILEVDGVDVIFGPDPDTINAGLFPDNPGETHAFKIRELDGTERSFSMTSATITSTPVQNVKTIDTGGGKAGYLLFTDHIATAEGELFDAITQLEAQGITDLVLDIRYNGGGFLGIASQLAYMIAGAGRTSGETFETIRFNDKHPEFNPITGSRLEPVPFYSRSQGFDPDLPFNTLLPSLDLSRVYVLTGSGTCSASESIINGLRGVDIEVIQVGSTTCGKPYGFFPASNCGTTYFTIQFQGVNAKGFGDYSDGFSPANTFEDIGVSIPGCSVGDDFSAGLGDAAEDRLAATLNHIDTGTCPAPSGLFDPELLISSSIPTNTVLVHKSLWQQNRIVKVAP